MRGPRRQRASPTAHEQSLSGSAERLTELCTLTTYGGLTFSALLTRSAAVPTTAPTRNEFAPSERGRGARPAPRPATLGPMAGSLERRLPRRGPGRNAAAPAPPPPTYATGPPIARPEGSGSPLADLGWRGGRHTHPHRRPDPATFDTTARWERRNPFQAGPATTPNAPATPTPPPAPPPESPPPPEAWPERPTNAFDVAIHMGRAQKRSPPPRGGGSPPSPAHARSRPSRGEELGRSGESPARVGDAEARALERVAREGALSAPGSRGGDTERATARQSSHRNTPDRRNQRAGPPPSRPGSATPRFTSPLARGRESLDARVRRLTSECGLDVPLSRSRGDVFTNAASGRNRALVARLDNAAATRVHDAADRERLGTALTWFLGFLRDTERVPFVDPDEPGGLIYNQKTLELFAEYISLRGSKKPGARGSQLNSDTIAAYVGAVKLAAARIQRRPLVSKEDNIRLPMQMKQMRKEQAPPGSSRNGLGSTGGGGVTGSRALCRALRAHHLRRIAQGPDLDRTSRRGIQDWAAALLAHNLLLRGGELGRSSKSGWDPRRGLTLESLDFREPCQESEGCPWMIVRIVAIKDANARNAPVFIPVRRRATFQLEPIDSDPLDAYDAVRLAWLTRYAEVPAHMRHEAPLFVSAVGGSMAAWTTDDSRRLAREYGRMANIDSADIGGKAFRVGGATDMRDALGDASIHLIKQRGRWASDIAQVYQRALVRSHLEASVLMSSNSAASRDMEELVRGWAQPAICM